MRKVILPILYSICNLMINLIQDNDNFHRENTKAKFRSYKASCDVKETLISYVIDIALISNFNLQSYLLKRVLEQTSSFILF